MTSVLSAGAFASNEWSEYAHNYDALLELSPYRKMMWDVSQEMRQGDNEVVLNASCGTGNFEHIHCEVLGRTIGSIVCTDYSEWMLNYARRKNADLRAVTYMPVDLNVTLPFENGTFTQVVSINTIYALDSPLQVLSEFRRVLRRNGRLLLVTPKAGYENGLIMKEHCRSELDDEFWMDAHSSPKREEELIRIALSDETTIQRMLAVARHNRNIAHNADFHFYTDEEIVTLMSKTGFRIDHKSLTYAKQDHFITATKE